MEVPGYQMLSVVFFKKKNDVLHFVGDFKLLLKMAQSKNKWGILVIHQERPVERFNSNKKKIKRSWQIQEEM